MDCQCSNLYIISFTVGGESGLALVAASSESQAKQVLRNSGKKNGCPDKYNFVKIRCLGLTSSCAYGLLMESYVDAMTAFNAIVSQIDKYLKGEKGDSILANMYVDEDLYVHIVENEYLITPKLSFDEKTRYITII